MQGLSAKLRTFLNRRRLVELLVGLVVCTEVPPSDSVMGNPPSSTTHKSKAREFFARAVLMVYRALDSKNPNPPPRRKPPEIIGGICDHLGCESRYEVRYHPEDEYSEHYVEGGCEHQDRCDLSEKMGCPVTSWVEENQAVCEYCGETGDNCKCGLDPQP